MSDLLILAAVLSVAVIAAGLWRRREGRARVTQGVLGEGTRERVGIPPGKPALLLFTTPTCRNCGAARDVLRDVAGDRPGVAVAEVDVAHEPEIARRLNVLRSPTVLVVDPSDQIRVRVSGVPDQTELAEALSGSHPA